QIWADQAGGIGAADRMARRAACRHEDIPPALLVAALRLTSRPALRIQPSFVVRFLLYDDVERHMRVLAPAEFGALPVVHAGPIRLHPDRRRVPGNEVAFRLQVGRPETV